MVISTRAQSVAARRDVLVVAEDTDFIHRAHETIAARGGRMIACLGPTHTRCALDDGPTCPLARGVAIALVLSPPSGEFRHRLRVISAGDYAAELSASHPGAFVILCGAAEGTCGPTGAVTTAEDPESALMLVADLIARDGIVTTPPINFPRPESGTERRSQKGSKVV